MVFRSCSGSKEDFPSGVADSSPSCPLDCRQNCSEAHSHSRAGIEYCVRNSQTDTVPDFRSPGKDWMMTVSWSQHSQFLGRGPMAFAIFYQESLCSAMRVLRSSMVGLKFSRGTREGHSRYSQIVPHECTWTHMLSDSSHAAGVPLFLHQYLGLPGFQGDHLFLTFTDEIKLADSHMHQET